MIEMKALLNSKDKEGKDRVDEIRRLNKKLASCIDRLKTEICSRKALENRVEELLHHSGY